MSKEFLKPKVATPQPEKPTPLPEPIHSRITPAASTIKHLLEHAGLLKKFQSIATANTGECAKQLKGMKGLSRDDGRKAFKQQVRDALDGKIDASEVTAWEKIERENSIRRSLVRAKAAKTSNEACAKLADILQEAKDKHLASFVETLLAAESAITPAAAILGQSPLRRLCGELPAFLDCHIQRLRTPSPFPRNACGLIN
jgi:hypothetical protein